VNDVLAQLPPGRWIAIDEFFRVLQAIGEDFSVAREAWKLYIAESYYGSFEYDRGGNWLLLQGRFVLAMLFEYAATLGLIDVAYTPPQGARDDYSHRWGTDDYDCLSRYDGLEYFRINALGAWVLGLSRDYEPEAPVIRKTWRVLPNHEVVSTEASPEPGDALFLDRVAERTSDRVWRLDREKILAAVEDGFDVGEVAEFLEARTAEPIPATVATLLDDLKRRASQLRDRGMVHMIECADAETARLLALDPKLKPLCLLAGERNLVFHDSDQSPVRARLRKLGYVLPAKE
jgi:Helicase conserved C-terminal domain